MARLNSYLLIKFYEVFMPDDKIVKILFDILRDKGLITPEEYHLVIKKLSLYNRA